MSSSESLMVFATTFDTFVDALRCVQVTSVAESAAGPDTGLQGFVGLLGVLAVPVVGYSLYTLFETGGAHFWAHCA